MIETLFILAVVTASLAMLRRRRNADDEAIRTIRKWRAGR